jgi:hypothetical protein
VECLWINLSCENNNNFCCIITKFASLLTCLLIALNVYLSNCIDTSYYTTICQNCYIFQINILKTHKSNTFHYDENRILVCVYYCYCYCVKLKRWARMEGIKSLFPLVLELFSNPSTKQKRQKCSHCLNKITTYCCVIYENYDGRHSCISSHTAISVRQNKTVRCRLHYIRL